MINVHIFRDRDNIVCFEIVGHSDYAQHGKDIVCAAVSVLAQTSLMALVEVCGIEESRLSYNIDDELGNIVVSLPEDIDAEEIEKSQIVFKTFELGIKAIIESYPNNVALITREV